MTAIIVKFHRNGDAASSSPAPSPKSAVVEDGKESVKESGRVKRSAADSADDHQEALEQTAAKRAKLSTDSSSAHDTPESTVESTG